jgi:hypothetical protein
MTCFQAYENEPWVNPLKSEKRGIKMSDVAEYSTNIKEIREK